jgi:hypothetical protein
MRRLSRLKTLPYIVLVLCAMAVLAMPDARAGDLTPHTAEYKVKIKVLSGRLNTELRATESGYVATHVIKPTGLARLHGGQMRVQSEFETAAEGVMPVAFHELDRSTNQASGTVGSEEVLLQLDGISHDNVSIQYELMHDLLNSGPSDTYVLFDVDKMRVANVRNIGTKSFKTKAGRFEAVGIQHQKEGSSRVTTLWCAPDLDYLPVIIEQHRKGKLNFRATLTKYNPT